MQEHEKTTPELDTDSSSSWSTESLDNILFYTPKIVNAIDDTEILQEIRKKYPQIDTPGVAIKDSRKAFISFVNDEEFITHLMTYYKISFYSLTTLFQNHYPYLFKTTSYIEKIATIVKSHKYDKFVVEE